MSFYLSDLCISLRGKSVRQSPGERTPLPGATATMGHSSNRTPAEHAPQPSFPQGHGAFRVDSHATERVAPIVPPGHHHSCQADDGQSSLGRRENHHHNLLVYPRFVFLDSVQINALWIRMG